MLISAKMPVAQEWHTHVQSISGPSTLQRLPSTRRQDMDNSSIASSAVVSESVKALTMARRLRRQPRLLQITESPPIVAESSPQDRQRISEFIEDVVELAETKGLYARDADLIENLDALVEISDKAAALNSTLIRSKAGMSAEAAAFHDMLPPMGNLTPQSLAQDVFHGLSLSDSASTSNWATTQSQTLTSEEPPIARLRAGMVPPTPAASTSDRTRSDQSRSVVASIEARSEDVSEMDSVSSTEDAPNTDVGPAAKEHLDLPGRIKLDLGGSGPVTCRLDLETSDASIRIWAVAVNQKRPGSVMSDPTAPAAATPSMLLSGRHAQAQEVPAASSQPRTFQHCFQTSTRRIPHFLHPDVEGIENVSEAPYTITFKERQYVFEEGVAESLRWSTSLKYVFWNEDSRKMLSEKIFGKVRLVTAGANRVQINGTIYSHMAAVTLWLDERSNDRSMSFFRNQSSGRNTPKLLEYQVLGLEDAKKASKSENSFTVMVKPMNASEVEPTTPLSPASTSSRRSSVLTSTTTNTTNTARSRARRQPDIARCSIDFSSPEFKKSFMKHVRHQYSPT